MRLRSCGTAGVVLVVAAATIPAASASPSSQFIPTLGGSRGCATAVRDDGTVFGHSERSAGDMGRFGFAWTDSGGVVAVSDPDASFLFLDTAGRAMVGTATGVAEWEPGQPLQPVDGMPTGFRPFFRSDDGTFGGYVDVDGSMHAARWAPGGSVIDLGTFGAFDAHIVDMNASGQMLMQGENARGHRGFLWDPQTGSHPLGNVFPGTADILVGDLNDHGVVVGHGNFGAVRRGFTWSLQTGMMPFGPETGTTVPMHINEHGAVAGSSYQLGIDRVFFWSPKRGFVVSQIPAFSVNGLSDHDQVVGEAGVAFAWDPLGGITTGAVLSMMTDVNNSGLAVGCSNQVEGDGTPKPHVWAIPTNVQVGWTSAELNRLTQLRAFYGYADNASLAKFGVYVLAFINAIDPQEAPTPVVLPAPGTAGTTAITWNGDELPLLNAAKHRWQLDDEDAHRWGFMVLSFIAAIQGH